MGMTMIEALVPVLAFAEGGGGGPMESIKHFIDVLAYPHFSFTLSLIAFYFMLRSRSLWTKRAGWILLALGVAGLLCFYADRSWVLSPGWRLGLRWVGLLFLLRLDGLNIRLLG